MAEPQPVVMYRVTLKDASGRVGGSATTVVVPDNTQKTDEPHPRGPQLFRFRVRTADGDEHVSAVAVGQPVGLEISDLRWGETSLDHGDETTMTAKVKRDHGMPLRFVVEHNDGGSWTPYAMVPATVKNGKATGKLRVHHPVLPPTGEAPSPSAVKSAEVAQLRFTLERGDAPQQEKAAPDDVKATSQAPAVDFTANSLAWGTPEHDHGDDAILRARVSGHAGQPVRFVVEHYENGSWKHYATIPAKVKGSEATASLRVHHPVLPPTGPKPSAETVHDADPAKFRFRVELGGASPQAKLEPRLAPPLPAPKFSSSELTWAKQEHDHGDETTLHAKVSGHAGKALRFVVETYENGTWKPYAKVPAVVKGDEATAKLRVHHPAAQKGKKPAPAKLRFKIEPGRA